MSRYDDNIQKIERVLDLPEKLSDRDRLDIESNKNKLLGLTDRFMLEDVQQRKELTPEQIQEVWDYRNALRDIRLQYKTILIISQVVYPIAPSFIK